MQAHTLVKQNQTFAEKFGSAVPMKRKKKKIVCVYVFLNVRQIILLAGFTRVSRTLSFGDAIAKFKIIWVVSHKSSLKFVEFIFSFRSMQSFIFAALLTINYNAKREFK